MEDKLKEGEYVRTYQGEIHKIVDIIENSEYDENLLDYIKFENDTGVYKDMIIKHSTNIIELLEYGDLVRFKGWGTANLTIECTDIRTNEKINLIFPDAEFCNGWNEDKMIYDLDYLIDKDQSDKIEWVLTHNQIVNSCYKVVD